MLILAATNKINAKKSVECKSLKKKEEKKNEMKTAST